MLAGHSQCVIVEAAADLPSPAEIQQSCSKLWGLCLCVVGEKLNLQQGLSQECAAHGWAGEQNNVDVICTEP